MAVKKIVLFQENEAALRKKSEPIKTKNRWIAKLINNLKDTLLAHPEGIGLAAPQINVHLRVVAVRLGSRASEDAEAGPPVILMNPEIVEAGDEQKDFDGCLSMPGLYGETVRPHYLNVTGLDEDGTPFERIFEGFDAVLVHHEIDHLDGILFTDRAANIDDLYRIEETEAGELVRVPIKAMLEN